METRRDNWLYWRARAGLAEEERDRLREALERIANSRGAGRFAVRIAREALSHPEGNSDA